MNILDQIIAHKQREVIQQKELVPMSRLKISPFFSKKVHFLLKNLLSMAHIQESLQSLKPKSPSKGIIKEIPEHQTRVEFVKKYYKRLRSKWRISDFCIDRSTLFLLEVIKTQKMPEK